jgi:hypothetical protein
MSINGEDYFMREINICITFTNYQNNFSTLETLSLQANICDNLPKNASERRLEMTLPRCNSVTRVIPACTADNRSCTLYTVQTPLPDCTDNNMEERFLSLVHR